MCFVLYTLCVCFVYCALCIMCFVICVSWCIVAVYCVCVLSIVQVYCVLYLWFVGSCDFLNVLVHYTLCLCINCVLGFLCVWFVYSVFCFVHVLLCDLCLCVSCFCVLCLCKCIVYFNCDLWLWFLNIKLNLLESIWYYWDTSRYTDKQSIVLVKIIAINFFKDHDCRLTSTSTNVKILYVLKYYILCVYAWMFMIAHALHACVTFIIMFWWRMRACARDWI